MKDVRAYRWIALDEPSVGLRIEAQAYDGDTAATEFGVNVQIYFADGDGTSNNHKANLVIEGTMIFAEDYPKPPAIEEFTLKGERPYSYLTPTTLCTHGMFHGKAFQGVESVDTWGTNGVRATLRILSADNFFRSFPNPEFITDPIMLDAAGQVVGCWAAELRWADACVFPYQLKDLIYYGANPKPPERVLCQVRVAILSPTRIVSSFYFFTEHGELFAELKGWEDRLFEPPFDFNFLRQSPVNQFLAKPLNILPKHEDIRCCLFRISNNDLESHWMIWKRMLSYIVLSRKEREMWRSVNGAGKRQGDWLRGRVAAKDAVRLWLRARYGITLCPADIEIVADEYGKPTVQGTWDQKAADIPAVSIAHTGDFAVAISGCDDKSISIGVDIEQMREVSSDFIEGAFSREEQQVLSAVADGIQGEWFLRAWCAKEAVAKALGRGLMGAPKNLKVCTVNTKTGAISVEISGKLAHQFTSLGGERLDATTLIIENNLIVAISKCPTR
jgi:phosphopantetheine--protein transferase-like protein